MEDYGIATDDIVAPGREMRARTSNNYLESAIKDAVL